jgi:hypothetical protein
MKESKKVTKEAIEELKKEHKQVFVLEVNLDGDDTEELDVQEKPKAYTDGVIAEFEPKPGTFYAVLKKPNNRVRGFAMTKHPDPYQIGNVILTNCTLLADDEIELNDDVNFLAAIMAAGIVDVGGSGKIKKY